MAQKKNIRTRRPADLAPEEMRAAIAKLVKRIEELEAFDVGSVDDRFDPRIKSLETKAETTVAQIFGTDTEEYLRHLPGHLVRAPLTQGIRIEDIREGLCKGILSQVSTLQTIIDLFEEELEEGGESPHGRGLSLISSFRLHPELDRRICQLFKDGHYANAVEDACKVLDGFVKIRSGKDDLSGSALMQAVFSAKGPSLAFVEDTSSESGGNVQRGMMFLYTGVMWAFRNPRAHQLMTDEPETAAQMILVVDYLMKELDRAKRVRE